MLGTDLYEDNCKTHPCGFLDACPWYAYAVFKVVLVSISTSSQALQLRI